MSKVETRRDFLRGMAAVVTTTLFNNPFRRENPLPDDVVSEKILEQIYGTTIHHLPRVQLYLRQKVLEEEPVFQWLKEGKELGRSLKIILVDSPSVGTPYFSAEQQAILGEEMWERLQRIETAKGKEFLENVEVRKRYLSYYQEKLDKLNQRLAKKELDKTSYDVLKERLDEYFRLFLQEPTQEDLAEIGAHVYVGLTVFTKDNKIYIFSAVGRKKWQPNQKPKLYDDMPDLTPRPYQSFPNPDNLDIINTNKTPGFVLRHEFGHIAIDEDGNLKAIPDENAVDKKALESLRRAAEALLEGDDSLYYFVFQGPAGIVITHNLKSLQKHRSVV